MSFSITRNPSDTYSVTRCDFDDLHELAAGAEIAGRNRRHWENKTTRLDGAAGSEWYGGIHSLADATALLTQGWSEGAAKAATLTPRLSNIVPPAKNIRRRVRWADTGTELSVDRALAGDWDCAWRNTGPHPMQPRVLSLACNFGGNGDVTHEQLFWCAAQMIVVCDVLEHAGYAVELRAVKCNTISQDRRVLLDVTVKQADQPMRADAIAAVFGHAGVYRTFGHMLLMTSPFDVGSGLGSAGSITAALQQATRDGLTDAPDYILEHAYGIHTAASNISKALTTLTGAPAND